MSKFEVISERTLLCEICEDFSEASRLLVFEREQEEVQLTICDDCLLSCFRGYPEVSKAILRGFSKDIPPELIRKAMKVAKAYCKGCHSVFDYGEIKKHVRRCPGKGCFLEKIMVGLSHL